METALQAKGLAKTYSGDGIDVPALRGVDLDVADGEFVAVMGPSGCGKSTLLHLLGGLDRPSAGTIRLGGRQVESLRSLSRVAEGGDTVSSLLAEGAALHLEADLRWLELCERRLLQEETDGNGASG